MNILFDIWINNSTIPAPYKFTPEEESGLQTIWIYIYDRVALLIDEIEKEENESSEYKKAIVIYLLNKPMAIQAHGYSERLTEKIYSCINENDVKTLWQTVENKLSSFIS
jgi:hypothetical protein